MKSSKNLNGEQIQRKMQKNQSIVIIISLLVFIIVVVLFNNTFKSSKSNEIKLDESLVEIYKPFTYSTSPSNELAKVEDKLKLMDEKVEALQLETLKSVKLNKTTSDFLIYEGFYTYKVYESKIEVFYQNEMVFETISTLDRYYLKYSLDCNIVYDVNKNDVEFKFDDESYNFSLNDSCYSLNVDYKLERFDVYSETYTNNSKFQKLNLKCGGVDYEGFFLDDLGFVKEDNKLIKDNKEYNLSNSADNSLNYIVVEYEYNKEITKDLLVKRKGFNLEN